MSYQVKPAAGGVLIELVSDDPYHPVTATEYVPNYDVLRLVEQIATAWDPHYQFVLAPKGVLVSAGHDNDPSITTQWDDERDGL